MADTAGAIVAVGTAIAVAAPLPSDPAITVGIVGGGFRTGVPPAEPGIGVETVVARPVASVTGGSATMFVIGWATFTRPTSMSCPPAVWWRWTAISTAAPGGTRAAGLRSTVW